MPRYSRGQSIVCGAAAYFAIVFACGFALGAMRTVWLVPRLGVRSSELLEMPVMVAVSYFSARWVYRRFVRDMRSTSVAPAIGALALALLVGAELALVLPLRQITLAEYWRERDPVSGTAYLLSLALFAVMPALVARAARAHGGRG